MCFLHVFWGVLQNQGTKTSYLRRICLQNPASETFYCIYFKFILNLTENFDPGYSGVLCQTQIDNCASRPCLNGGTCTNGVGSYACECTPHFTGETCGDEVEGKIFNETIWS